MSLFSYVCEMADLQQKRRNGEHNAFKKLVTFNINITVPHPKRRKNFRYFSNIRYHLILLPYSFIYKLQRDEQKRFMLTYLTQVVQNLTML